MTKWTVYTLGLGLILILFEIIIYISTKGVNYSIYYSIEDLLGYSLLLNISNINELEHVNAKLLKHKKDKTLGNGYSIAGIAAAVFCFTLHTSSQAYAVVNKNVELHEKTIILGATLITVVFSVLMSWRTIKKIEIKKGR